MSIFSGQVTDRTMFHLCMFKYGEAFWANDDRAPTLHKSSWGPDLARQEYVFVVTCGSGGRTCSVFSGFHLPYKHVMDAFKSRGFNVTLSEFFELYKKQWAKSPKLRQNVAELMKRPYLCFDCFFDYNTFLYLYKSDMDVINSVDAFLAYQSPDPASSGVIAFPKDENGFFIVDTQAGAFRSVEILRKPIMT